MAVGARGGENIKNLPRKRLLRRLQIKGKKERNFIHVSSRSSAGALIEDTVN